MVALFGSEPAARTIPEKAQSLVFGNPHVLHITDLTRVPSVDPKARG